MQLLELDYLISSILPERGMSFAELSEKIGIINLRFVLL